MVNVRSRSDGLNSMGKVIYLQFMSSHRMGRDLCRFLVWHSPLHYGAKSQCRLYFWYFSLLVCVVTNYLPLCNGDNMSQASRPIVQFRVTVTQSRGDHMGEVTAGVTTKQTANKTEESDLRNHNSLPTMMEHWSIKKHAKYTWALHEQYLS